MNKGSLIIRNSVEQTNENTIKSETISYCNITGAQRTVSQTFVQPSGKPPSKFRKIIRDISYTLPQIAIKQEDDTRNSSNSEIVLVNGCWDISNKIPNIVAEMHNIKSEELHTLQNTCTYKTNSILADNRDYINPSPRSFDSGIEPDCTDGNLSWLLNYKISELPPVPDEKVENNTIWTSTNQINNYGQNSFDQIPSNKQCINNSNAATNTCRTSDNTNVSQMKDDNRSSGHSYRYSGPKKPPFTYTELIENALSEKGELTVSGIYQWISEHFPFYKQNDDRWKNSVRHNLSINPHFRKGNKAVHGAGHLWTIALAQKDDKKTWQIKQRMQHFIQSSYKETNLQEQEAFDMELEAATASIAAESYTAEPEEFIQQVTTQNEDETCNNKVEDIQVEYINVINVSGGLEDFLSPPVSKQQLVQECGLGNDFLITDLNPNAIGVNLSEAEVVTEDALYDDIALEYYELHKE